MRHLFSTFGLLAATATAACSPERVGAPASDPAIVEPGDASARLTGNYTAGCTTAFHFAGLDPSGAPIIQIDEQCRFTFPKNQKRRATASALQTLFPDGSLTSTLTYTFENGDQLFGSFAGFATPPGAGGHLTFTGTETFTGGTGRLQGAVGSATLVGEATITDPNALIGTGGYRTQGALQGAVR